MDDNYLFENIENYEYNEWGKEWQDMPEFKHKDLTPYQSVIIHFENKEDRKNFSKLIKQTITIETKSLWYPKAEIETYVDKEYVDEP